MLEVEPLPQSCIPQVQIGLSTEKSLLVERHDFRPSKQYILLRVIPSYFRLAKERDVEEIIRNSKFVRWFNVNEGSEKGKLLLMALQPFVGSWPFFYSFVSLYTFCWTPFSEDQPVAMPLPTQQNTDTKVNTCLE
jgi:hypothetical protein